MLKIIKRVGIIYGVVALFGLGTFLSTMFPLAGVIVIGSAILLFLSRLKLKPLPPCPHPDCLYCGDDIEIGSDSMNDPTCVRYVGDEEL